MTSKQYTNLAISRQTLEQVDLLAGLMTEDGPPGAAVSKHKAVAQAVHDAIRRQQRTNRRGSGSSADPPPPARL